MKKASTVASYSIVKPKTIKIGSFSYYLYVVDFTVVASFSNAQQCTPDQLQ